MKSLIFTHYEDMKGEEKCKNWGGLGVTECVYLVPFLNYSELFVKCDEF